MARAKTPPPPPQAEKAPCEECSRARQSPEHPRFNNRACIYCAARHIQFIRTLGIGRHEASARSTASLAIAIESGHAEARVRELAKGPRAIEPLPEK